MNRLTPAMRGEVDKVMFGSKTEDHITSYQKYQKDDLAIAEKILREQDFTLNTEQVHLGGETLSHEREKN